MKTVCKTSVVKPEGKTPLGRYGCRWTEYFKNGLKEICYGWIHAVQERGTVSIGWTGFMWLINA
jgi:hypothetical protein